MQNGSVDQEFGWKESIWFTANRRTIEYGHLTSQSDWASHQHFYLIANQGSFSVCAD